MITDGSLTSRNGRQLWAGPMTNTIKVERRRCPATDSRNGELGAAGG